MKGTRSMSMGGAKERVERLLGAARRLADSQDPLGRRAREWLPETTGLSTAGIEWALTESLETHPGEQEVEALCRAVPTAPQAHVSLSANVFVAAHRAIALGLASSPEVSVRASRREPNMATLLSVACPGLFRLTDKLAASPGDHVWAYGTDETLASLRSELKPGVILHPHGSGLGVAVVAPNQDLARAAESLATDVMAFDQRGCLSPRVVLMLAEAGTARAFAMLLAEKSDALERAIPRGRLTASELGDERLYRDTLQYRGDLWPAGKGSVSLDVEGHRIVLPPPGRNVHLVTGTSLGRLQEAVEPWIVSVGVAGDASLWEAVRICFPKARVSALGKMQCPRFDGPVDLRPDPNGELL